MSTRAQIRAATAAGYRQLFEDVREAYRRNAIAAAELDAPELKLMAMGATIQVLGQVLAAANKHRGELPLAGPELAQIDEDLSGLNERFLGLYSRFDLADLPPADTWTDEDWTDFRDDYEGPILDWTAEQARERWGIPLVPPPPGPDLLLAFQLVNAIATAREFEDQRRDPLVSGTIQAMIANAQTWIRVEGENLSLEVGAALDDFGRDLADAGEKSTAFVSRTLRAALETAGGFITSPLFWIVGGIGAAIYLQTRTRR
jgi:hypothetical protein